MESWLYKGSYSLDTDIDSRNLVALSINILAYLVVFWPEALPKVREETLTFHVAEERVGGEDLPVDMDRHGYA